MPYRADRGGHAPGHIREQFVEWMEDETQLTLPAAMKLTGQLWNCSDVMPGDLCQLLELPSGSTYAQGARHWRDTYSQELRRPVQRWEKIGLEEPTLSTK